MAQIKTNENAYAALDQYQTVSVSRITSSRATWLDLGGPSPIERS